MKKSITILLMISTLLPIAHGAKQEQLPDPHFAAVAGGGSSIKGFGETDQTVYTAEIMLRYARPLFSADKGLIQGRHHLWIETPVAFIIHDSDTNDSQDFGIVGLNFLAVWIFPQWKGLEPYILAGGGPRYVIADIDGVGADVCGNYQFGIGTYLLSESDHKISLEVRYDHISNLELTTPNVPLNSVKVLFGCSL